MVNYDTWDQLLRQYVDANGQVDYAAWQTRSPESLNQWLRSLSEINIQSFTKTEGLAFWINLYNALVIAEILKRYPIATIRPKILGIPNWIAYLGFFRQPLIELQEEAYSLDRIEHETLRPQYQEPRIHFALVCAAIGCPLLRSEAYWPERVESQLEEDAQRFIQNPDKVRYDSPSGVLYCSKIFQWYCQDFVQAAGSVPQFIDRYLNRSLSATTPIRYLPYDWQLNQRTSS